MSDINDNSGLTESLTKSLLNITDTIGHPVIFKLTELSSEVEFDRIAKLARNAGILFKYQVHHRRKRRFHKLFLVQDFKIFMSIKGTKHYSEISVNVPKRGKFIVEFGWYANEAGKAVSLTESVKITKATSFHPKKIIN